MGETLNQFVKWRCRVQRLADAKLMNGWVERETSNGIVIRLSDAFSMQVGDVVALQLGCRKRSAVVRGVINLTDGAAIGVELTDDPQYLPAETSSRRLIGPYEGVMTLNDGSDATHNVEILNASEGGIGLLVDEKIAPRTQVNVRFSTQFGPIHCVAWVRHCRPDPHSKDLYRAGVEFTETGRPNREIWTFMLDQVEKSAGRAA